MSDDFIIEEQERSAGSPFLILVGILGAIFILAIVCIGTVLLSRGGGNNNVDPIAQATSDAIVATNEAVMTQNAFVTQTLIARTLTAAAPTNTPTPSPTSTNTPIPTPTNTETPVPTETPVVSTGDDGGGDGTVTPGEATPTTSIFGTPIFSGGGSSSTPTPVTVTGGTGSTGSSGGTGGSGTLPQTGLPLWGIIGLGAGFVVLIGVARRLRAS